MATDELTLIAEVRNLTEYDSSIVSDADFQKLVDVAKREIRAKVGVPDLQFFTSTSLNEERALFWLSCLFAKIKAGELENVRMTVGDVEEHTLRVNREGSDAVIWKAEFDAYLTAIQPSDMMFGIRGVARRDREREYGYE